MGAQIKNCLCNGVYIVNGLPLLRTTPNKCLLAHAQTVSFHLEGNALSIRSDIDDLTNTESVISEDNLRITLLKTSKGISTRLEKISEAVSSTLRNLDDTRVEKVIFAEPKASDDNKAIIFEAIFEGIYTFTANDAPRSLHTVYVNWNALSKADMLEIITRVLRRWMVLTVEY